MPLTVLTQETRGNNQNSEKPIGIGQHMPTENTLNKLLELSRVLATTRDIDVAMNHVVNAVVEIVPAAERCTLQWLEDDGETLHTLAFSDVDDLTHDIPLFRPGVGIAGHALASLQIINVPDVLEDERFVQDGLPPRFRSLLVAPLVVREQPLGTLSLSSAAVDAFASTDTTLVQLVADQIAAALDNARDITARLQAETALQRYTERLRILHQIDQSILAARSPETIAVVAIRRIRELIPCCRAIVMSVEETGQLKLLAAESSGGFGLVEDINIYQELFKESILASGRAYGVEDLAGRSHHSSLQETLHAAGVQSYVVVPLSILGELVGALTLESDQPRAFTPDHMTIATEVAVSLAVSIRQARLYEQAQQELSERMQIEARLRQYTTALERQNAELDAFAHTVAHDLKNPVTTIVCYATVLEQEGPKLPEGAAQKFLSTVTQGALKLSTIIDELLLLSSVRDMSQVETRPLEMGRIVAEARGRLLHQIEQHQGEIILPESWPVAVGYGPWVEAVWANYISNALKYGGRPPHVELGSVMQADGTIRFWVRDNGPGLSPEEQARLFTPFERLHRERTKGHGLGLSIVQRIAQRLGGQVGVESEGVPGRGSTFYFTLPGLPADGS